MGLASSDLGVASEDDNPFIGGSVPSAPLRFGINDRPLRVLCLHGRGSCNKVTQMQASFIGLYQKVQCDFLEGPLLAKPFSSAVERAFRGNFYQWYSPPRCSACTVRRVRSSKAWSNVERGLKRVLQYAQAHGPYDGVFGFSQGAGVATLLSRSCVMRALGHADGRPPWRFVICACGVDIGLPMHLADRENRDDGRSIKLPSFHLIGRKDMIRWFSSSLAATYVKETIPTKSVYYIDAGHELPMRLMKDTSLQDALGTFLEGIEASI
eukprot:TRINITY_DN77339_c0_g1_i1.p1 TRINITY_DN77339_c0_g1~~TRINITY_DN77339_c0_g1_i1.p1  ORF type:complete len:267 (-),score=20.62 TRINITY_DN77339_c0_g1_i1:59-859(-)